MHTQNATTFQSVNHHALAGAYAGVAVWFTYGLVEFLCSTLTPLLLTGRFEIGPSQWPLQALLLLSYCWIGSLLGAIAAVLTQRAIFDASVRTHPRIAALLTLVIAWLVNLLSLPPVPKIAWPGLAFALLLTAVFVQALRSDAWRISLNWIANPWTVSFLLLGSQWIGKGVMENGSTTVRLAFSSLFLLAVLAVSWLIHRFLFSRPLGGRSEPRPSGSVIPGWQLEVAALAAIFGILFICAAMANRPPRLSFPAREAAAPQSKPNLVLVVMDTVRADHLSLYGYTRKTSPVLEQLAKESAVFTNAFATADFTLPAHASIFTGLYPSWHRAHSAPPQFPFGRRLDDGIETLAGMLQKRGYRTMAEIANGAYLDPKWGLARGFDVFDNRLAARLNQTDETPYLREGMRRLLSFFIPTGEYDLTFRHGYQITEQAGKMLEEAHAGKAPFFLFLNYMDAHAPYVPPAPFNRMFRDDESGVPLRRYVNIRRLVLEDKEPIAESDRRSLVSQYDGGVAAIDHEIGELVSGLKKLGVYENTLLIVTADHGEAFGERNLLGHQVSVYQNQIHVPLLIKYPNSRQASTSDDLVSQVDLLPTVLDVLDYEAPPYLQGRSLAGNNLPGDRMILSESFPFFSQTWNVTRLNRTARALMSGPFKYIASTKGTQELYRLSNDPEEEHNLYTRDNSDASILQSKLSSFLKRFPRDAHGSPGGKRDDVNLDRLRSLGYVQ